MRPSRMLLATLAALAFLASGCTDYGLAKAGGTPVEGDTGAPVAEDSAAPTDTAPADTGSATTDAPLVPCDAVALESLEWWGSQPFSDPADPADSAGRTYADPAYEMQGWSTVVLPDVGHTPSGTDRAYRGWFHLDAVPEGVYVELESDDGVWLSVNGAAMGHWGGGWQEEGCVNDEGGCTVTTVVEPVAVTAQLVAGDNLVAARVSNAIMGSYFQLHAYCPE